MYFFFLQTSYWNDELWSKINDDVDDDDDADDETYEDTRQWRSENLPKKCTEREDITMVCGQSPHAAETLEKSGGKAVAL